MSKTIPTLLFLFLAQVVFGQYQIGLVPRESPDKAVYQKIGYTEVNVKYGSPAVKNREIWGDLVPYNRVWRSGANNATTVEFSSEVQINGMELDSGKYALFILPKDNDRWTIIFNQVHQQWGAFNYDQEEDALRVDILPRRTDFPTENLTYSISQFGYKYGSILLNWEYVETEIPFETNYLNQFEQEVEVRAMQQPAYIKWIVYLQGAEHLLHIQSKNSLALSWINQAEEIMDSTSEWNEQFYPRDYIKGHVYWTKAKLFAQCEQFKEALVYAEKTQTVANPIFYDEEREDEAIDRLIDEWRGR